MKRVLALGAVAAVALVAAAPSSAASDPRVTALQKQVKALQAQVKTLTTQVKTLQKREQFDRSEISANYEGDACLAVTMTDLIQGTWTTIDQGSTTPRFVAQGQVDDKSACSGIGVTRTGIKTPPVFTAVDALITWIIG